MKKQLLFFLLFFITITSFAQTYDVLPAGSKPYGNQLYLTPSGQILSGNAGLRFKVLGTKAYVDSLTAAKVTLNPTIPQIGSIDLGGAVTTRNMGNGNAVTYNSNGMTNLLGFNVSVDAQGVNLNGNDIKFNSAGVLLGRVGNGSNGPLTEFQHMRVTNAPLNTLDAVRLGDLSTFTATVNTIADLQDYSGLSTTLIVQQSLRGGTFNLKTGLTPDGGTVFEATGLGAGYYWQRDITNSDGYHVDWFGAVGYPRNNRMVGDVDSKAAFQATIDARSNRNTPVILGYGVYMISDTLRMGEGTRFIGKSTLWPRQYFGDGSVFIDYTNMSAVRFYNTSKNGFGTTSEAVAYRSSGIAFYRMGIFGPGRQYNTIGVNLRRTENSTSPAKTTGLVTMEDVYFADWGTGTNGANSADSWYLERVHFADVKIGLIGGSGQTFLHHTDFFKIDSIGIVLNSPNDPDVVDACEIETRYASAGAIVVNGRAIISNTQFLTNRKAIIFNSTANRSIVSSSTFLGNSDTDISLASGATDITLSTLIFDKNYTNNAGYNYNFSLEPANYLANSIYATGSNLKLDNNTFIKSQSLYTGASVLIDNSTIMSTNNKYRGYYTYTNDKNISFTGTNTKLDTYDVAGREINGNTIVGGTLGVAGNTTIGGTLGVTGNTTLNGATNSQTIRPLSDLTYDFGNSSFQWSTGYFTKLASKIGTSMTIGTEGSNTFNFMTGGINRAKFDGTGNFIPLTDNTYLNGSSGATWSNLFTTNLRISLNGLLKGNGSGTNVSPAVAGIDYVAPSTLANYFFISVSGTAPTPTSTGVKGEIRPNIGGYRYECVSTDTWVRTVVQTSW